MKRLQAILAILAATMLSGCFTVERFADGAAYYNKPHGVMRYGCPYKATKQSYNYWFLGPARLYGWWGLKDYDPILSSFATIFWPLSLADLPCEAAIDTIMVVPDAILAK